MAEFVITTTIKREVQCRFCSESDLIKYGKYKKNQYYFCKSCGKKFCDIDAYPRMKYPRSFINDALTFYYNGMSYRNISQTFEDKHNLKIPKSTFYRWTMKYSDIANKHALKMRPELSDVWVADETVVKLWGKNYWYWDIIDTDTRFLIATHLSRTRTIRDAKKLFYQARIRSKTRPKKILTDKMHSYNSAFNKVFYSSTKKRRVKHLTSKGFGSKTNINLIERFHGTVKQRIKVMRNLKKFDSGSITLDGFITHYNFFMEHSFLGNRTPALVAGIGKDIEHWGNLIDDALWNPIENPAPEYEWDEYAVA